MMSVEICHVGKIMMISLRRNRFRYSCNFHCIKYDSLIISTYHSIELAHTCQKSMPYIPLCDIELCVKTVKLYHNTYCTRFSEYFFTFCHYLQTWLCSIRWILHDVCSSSATIQMSSPRIVWWTSWVYYVVVKRKIGSTEIPNFL